MSKVTKQQRSNGTASGPSHFKATHRVIASRGMSFPAMLLGYKDQLAYYMDDHGATCKCHRSEIVALDGVKD